MGKLYLLYPQNGERIVTIDSVTSLHPIYCDVGYRVTNGNTTRRRIVAALHKHAQSRLTSSRNNGAGFRAATVETALTISCWWLDSLQVGRAG